MCVPMAYFRSTCISRSRKHVQLWKLQKHMNRIPQKNKDNICEITGQQTSLSDLRGRIPIMTLLSVSFRRSLESIIRRLSMKQNKMSYIIRGSSSKPILQRKRQISFAFGYLALSLTAILIEEPGNRTLSLRMSRGRRFGRSLFGMFLCTD